MIFGPARVFPVEATAVDVDTLQVPGILHGWGWLNTSTTVRADLELHDGPIGPLIVPISLAPGESTRDWLGALGITCIRGVTVQVTAGAVEGTLWFRPLPQERIHDTLDLTHMLGELVEAMFGG